MSTTNYNLQGTQDISTYQASQPEGIDYQTDILLHSGSFLSSERTRNDLENILGQIRNEITEVLDRCGIYYRITARVKSRLSADKKLSSRDEHGNWIYHDKHHLQDLFGFRILIYFIEDMSILKRLFQLRFQPVAPWTQRKYKEEEFSAIAVNGVFRIDESCIPSMEVLDSILAGQFVDPTFEIQLRTVSFDAWHEIDHDYSYKFTNMWRQQGEYLRRFHSILATLELCDDTMVTTLENLAYDIYARRRHPGRYTYDETQMVYDWPKQGIEGQETAEHVAASGGAEKENTTASDEAKKENTTASGGAEEEITAAPGDTEKEIIFHGAKRSTLCDWDRMIRAHFRLRILHEENVEVSNQELLPELAEFFEKDAISDQKDSYRFVKYVLRFQKETLIRLFYDPKGFLSETKEKYQENNNQTKHTKQLWEEFNFRSKIPITVNTIVIMILLYKDARENSLTREQGNLLVRDAMKGLVCVNDTQSDIISLAKETGTLFTFLPQLELAAGWNTVLKNNLSLITNLREKDWISFFLEIIRKDARVLWAKITDSFPDSGEILAELSRSGSYQYQVKGGRAYSFMISCETIQKTGNLTDGLKYYIEYPGMVYAENTWRQMVSFSPAGRVKVIGGEADTLLIHMNMCIQAFYNNTSSDKRLPMITEPHIYQVIRQQSKGMVYPAKPYIGQLRDLREQTHGTDIVNIKCIRKEPAAELMISNYFEGAYRDGKRIHPMILFLFDSEKALFEAEPAIAIFENRIAHTAYVYIGIIRDEQNPVFEKYYKNDKESFIPLSSLQIKGSGVYIFGNLPAEESGFILSLSFDRIQQIDYTLEGLGTDAGSETLHGMDALLYLLERELRRYNMVVEDTDISRMVDEMDTIMMGNED